VTAAVLPARHRQPSDPRLLQRCLLLAVLLHIWLVLVFGNASGTAAPGQGVWGSLTVKLLGRSGSQADAPPSDNSTSGSSGSPAQARSTNEAGAAKLGRPNPREVPPEAARTDEASDAPPSTSTLELPEGFKPVERQDLKAPPPRATPLQTPSAELPAAVGRLEARPEPKVAPLPSPTDLRAPDRPAELQPPPTELPAAVNRLDATTSPDRAATLPRPAELRAPAPLAAPINPSAELPATVRRLETPVETGTPPALPRPAELRALPVAPQAVAPSTALPAPVRRLEAASDAPAASPALPRAADLRAAPPSTLAQPTPSTALPAAVQRLEAPATEGRAVTPLAPSNDLHFPAATAPSATPSLNSQDLPAAVRRLESTEGASAITPLQAAPSARTAPATPSAGVVNELSRGLPGEVSAPAGPAQGDPNANPYAAPKASAGSPDAGSRLGPDLPAPPTAAASAPRQPLNLSLPRGDIAARRGPGLVDLLPQPPERKSKLEQSIEDAANKDCRKAYANAGILAAVPLAIDAARGKGCKW
jgi:Meckel syndrome type 1 protein